MQTSVLPDNMALTWADYPGLVKELLTRRGINNAPEAIQFFNPSLAHISDPSLLAGIDTAVARVIKALTEGELIYILGDYDTDGICGTALLADGLASLGGKVKTYIPDRFKEGYGLSAAAVATAAKDKAGLLITVDCGTKNIDEVAAAKKAGIDVIVCDHHTPDAILPKAIAILNPLLAGNTYPNQSLTGCGVAFVLWQAIAKAKNLPNEQVVSYLDLVAIATCADAASLAGQNRTLVALGLHTITNGTLRPGLDALLEQANLHPQQTPFPLDAHRIVYSIAPRLNAAGRMADGNLSVELLLAKTLEEAMPLAAKLEVLNNQRRDLDQAITAEALEMIRGTEGGENAPATVLFHPDWSVGVLGITASRLLEYYPRPTVVLTEQDGVLTGSARSGPSFDVYAALTKCQDLLSRFGGHSYAAGLALPKENLGLFLVRFSQLAYEGRQNIETPVPARMLSEAPLNFKEVTPQLCRWMDAMAPFGPGNARPLFSANDLMLLEESRVLLHKVTRQPNHLMLLLADKEGYVLEAAGWGMAKLWDRIVAQGDISMTFHLEIYRNRNGQDLPRLVVRHLNV